MNSNDNNRINIKLIGIFNNNFSIKWQQCCSHIQDLFLYCICINYHCHIKIKFFFSLESSAAFYIFLVVKKNVLTRIRFSSIFIILTLHSVVISIIGKNMWWVLTADSSKKRSIIFYQLDTSIQSLEMFSYKELIILKVAKTILSFKKPIFSYSLLEVNGRPVSTT